MPTNPTTEGDKLVLHETVKLATVTVELDIATLTKGLDAETADFARTNLTDAVRLATTQFAGVLAGAVYSGPLGLAIIQGVQRALANSATEALGQMLQMRRDGHPFGALAKLNPAVFVIEDIVLDLKDRDDQLDGE